MVDSVIGVVTESVLNKALSLAADEIVSAWNVKKDLKKLAEELQMIQALLSDASSKQVTSEAVKLWLKKLRSASLDAQIVLDEFNYEVLRQQIKGHTVRSFFSSSNPVVFRTKMAHKVRDVLSSFEALYVKSNEIGLQAGQFVSSIPEEKHTRLTGPYMEDSKIVGREDDVLTVTRMLIETEHKDALPVIAILGMGGQGKTTLAQLVYNHDTVTSYFDKTIWITVSDDFNINRLLAEMIRSSPETNYQSANREYLVEKLKKELKDKKYLLVLDDIWNESGDVWNQMRACLLAIGGSRESKVLATTRNQDVASAMRASTFQLDILSKEKSWELFEKYAFSDGGATRTAQLVEIGEKILKKCGGVPLAIITIGGLLYKNTETDFWSMIERSETWSSYGEGDMVLSAIKLSYDHLPSLSVKQCFAYCAIFKKDRLIKKDELVRLWMANGLLHPSKGSQMEDTGNNYFKILIRSSLLQGVNTDDENNLVSCRMHDLVHDVSLKVSENCCCHVKHLEVGMNVIEAVHVSIDSSKWETWESWKSVLPQKLRTLYLRHVELSVALFEKFKCISVLIIVNWAVVELPDSVGKLKILRYLDIVETEIKRLPESFNKLYHLQTLRVRSLEELPKGFGDLINLRHIYFHWDWESENILFPGISQLRKLQTLPHFKVDRCKGCSIEELEHLDCLRGTLTIKSLQNVVSHESASKSNLFKKSNIRKLQLYWDKREGDDSDDHADVMEGLKPHSNLRSLEINGYCSQRFPAWMDRESNLLCNLVELRLNNLDKCETIPSLGYLPCLQKLHLMDMKSVVEWLDPNEMIPTPSSSSSSVQVKVFSCLKGMHIVNLPNLSVLPNFFGSLSSLEELQVEDCKNLRIESGEWNKKGLNSDIQYHFPSLLELTLNNCEKLSVSFCSLNKSLGPVRSLRMYGHPDSWIKEPHHLISLGDLSLGAKNGVGVESSYPWPFPINCFPSLTSLRLNGKRMPRGLKYLPSQLQYLTSLTKLEIWHFEGLEVIPEWLGDLRCLQTLEFNYCSGLKELPALQRLTKLRRLEIYKCPLLEEKCSKGSGSEWPKISHIPDLHIF